MRRSGEPCITRRGEAAPAALVDARARIPQNGGMRTLLLLAAAALTVAGCGAHAPEQRPVEFLEVLFAQLYGGDHAGAWTSLYPAHQRVATRGLYVACEEQAPAFAGTLERVEVLSAREEPWRVAGQAEPLDATTVRYRITVSLGGDREHVDGSGHLVAVDGSWRWILKRADFDAYRAGRCPVTGPTS
jgi:hypothetical protein